MWTVFACAAANAEKVATATDSFHNLLAENVSNGVVNYDGISLDALQPYVDYVAEVDIDRFESREALIAFYLNAYNALSIKGILDGKSPSSFLGRVNFFKRATYIIAGEKMDLYDFEHEVIRPLNEPRIHFALVCASISCPKLRSEVYRADRLDAQLNENAIEFINDQEKNHFDKDKNIAHISKIFKWFTEDFELTGLSLQQYIAQYVNDDDVRAVLEQDAFKIKHPKYNWKLNGIKTKKK